MVVVVITIGKVSSVRQDPVDLRAWCQRGQISYYEWEGEEEGAMRMDPALRLQYREQHYLLW